EVIDRGGGLCGELADSLHDLVGLLDRIMTIDADGVVEVLGALPAQPDDLAALRHHRLGQIVIEFLLGICVLGVELANAFVGHLSYLNCALKIAAAGRQASTFKGFPHSGQLASLPGKQRLIVDGMLFRDTRCSYAGSRSGPRDTWRRATRPR